MGTRKQMTTSAEVQVDIGVRQSQLPKATDSTVSCHCPKGFSGFIQFLLKVNRIKIICLKHLLQIVNKCSRLNGISVSSRKQKIQIALKLELLFIKILRSESGN